MRKFLSGILLILLVQIFCLSAADAKTKQNTPAQEYKYQQKVLRKLEVEKYKKSLLPESGYMTNDEYEEQSKDVSDFEQKVPEPKLPKDIKMKYVPQPTFKMVLYNNPPGTPELSITRTFKFNRQENGKGITSPDKSMIVYPVIYYYALNQCTSGDLFVIKLDKTIPDVDRILGANVIRRDPVPILSTDKSIKEKFVFRTMTPIDFSPDGKKLLAKEKIGFVDDGIWKTNAWVYDFDTKTSTNLVEVREAIRFYWANTKGVMLDDKRWDIYPLGFDATDSNRIIVSAYGYTGTNPKFLGNWSIDCNGEQTRLVSLFDQQAPIVSSGFKLEKSGVINPQTVFEDEKKLDKAIKKKRKLEKHALKQKKKQAKAVLNKKLNEMKKEEYSAIGAYKKQNRVHAQTGAD